MRSHKLKLDARTLLCLVQVIIGMIMGRSVNLRRLALHCDRSKSKLSSREKRLSRFFARFTYAQDAFARIIMKAMGSAPVLLSLDRTNWKLGKYDINFLVLAVCWKGIAVPLFWLLLPHQGCSNVDHRRTLVQQFLDLFGASSVQALVADREFVGPEWLSYLEESGITFHVRIKNNVHIEHFKKEAAVKNVLNALKPGEWVIFSGKRRIGKRKEAQKHFVVGLKPKAGNDFVILISNREPHEALSRYKKRWEIETLFSALKTRGFCLESTHLRQQTRLLSLFGVLSLAFFWAYRLGHWIHQTRPIRLKKHGHRAISFVRYGLDALNVLLRQKIPQTYQKLVAHFLAPPPILPPKLLNLMGV
jgi:hypothetical protein